MLSPADHIVQLEHVVRTQMTAIDELRGQLGQLRTENQRLLNWIMGDEPDALTALQRVYSDPKTSVLDDFKEKVRNIRLRTLEQDLARWAAEDAAKTIEHQGTILGSDGDPAA